MRAKRSGMVLPGALESGGERWAWEAIATGPDGQAVKISVMEDHEANATEAADLRSQATGLYRRRYMSWTKGQDFTQRYIGGRPPQGSLLSGGD